ncbi:MAG: hypothetical protein HFH38_09270 [Lachnospiraceae bacterium]|jgi:hypothetical protein|nr:hypothetical protein [Lachnospiraceae bacterium]
MKIYHKKNFTFGLSCIALALLNTAAAMISKFDGNSILFILALLFFGAVSIFRSLSPHLAREDVIESLDERNQWIELRTKSKSFQVTQGICFILMLTFLVIGKLSGETAMIGIGVGIGFTYAVSMLSELAVFCYYESRL